MTDECGPFQHFWDAWSEVGDQIRSKNLEHFRLAVEIQFAEMREHIRDGDRHAAAREVTDVICIALNMMRWLGYQPAEIAVIARDRAERRMRGRTNEILEKYQQEYGI